MDTLGAAVWQPANRDKGESLPSKSYEAFFPMEIQPRASLGLPRVEDQDAFRRAFASFRQEARQDTT